MKNAKELLAELAATTGPDCNCAAAFGHTKECAFERWVTDVPQQELQDKARATLAVAIKLAEAAQHSADEDCSCKAREALAEWEALGYGAKEEG